jgi:hypothetical protein
VTPEIVHLKFHSKFGLLRKPLKKASAENLICPRMRIPGKGWKDLKIVWGTKNLVRINIIDKEKHAANSNNISYITNQ